MNTVPAAARIINPTTRPLLLLTDLRYPSTKLRGLYDGEVQTDGDLYLAEVIAMENPNSKTTRLSVTVTRASDGRTISYNKLIAKMRIGKDGQSYHRISIPSVGGCETVSQALQLVLRDAANRFEGAQVAM